MFHPLHNEPIIDVKKTRTHSASLHTTEEYVTVSDQ